MMDINYTSKIINNKEEMDAKYKTDIETTLPNDYKWDKIKK